MPPHFIHLRLHSEYSLVDGLVRIKPLMEALDKLQMPAIALTDQNNLFAAIKFYKAAVQSGIKPILGADIKLEHIPHAEQIFQMTLLCLNEKGYKNLLCLISKAYMEGQHKGIPRINYAWLREVNEGLIALSGAMEGDVGIALLANKQQQAYQYASGWAAVFGDRYYLEIQRIGHHQEQIHNQRLLELAQQLQIPIVATNPVQFIEKGDFEAHEARVCIHQGFTLGNPKRPQKHTEQQYLKSDSEMLALFRDLPEALQNSVEIAKRCNVQLKLGQSYLPNFPVPEGMAMADYFAELAKRGLEQRLAFILDKDAADYAQQCARYFERLQLELGVINSTGFQGYFLIVADFIQWAKRQGIPVGPGRGSGPGSLVAYALQITDLDPLAYDLLFERFLNPERVSMPDFDIDFCMEGRDRVIEYVMERYGRESVAQIITYGSMAAKAVIRDVGRVLNHPYGFVDKIAKLVPFELGMTLEKALSQEEELNRRYKEEEEVKALIDLAMKLEGIARNAGKHAGGVVIAPSRLTDFTPLYCEEGSLHLITQFDKNDVEEAGLVKFDFLGLRTLTIIDWAMRSINQKRLTHGEEPLDISRIDLEDPATFALLKACATSAVFQVESRGMKDLIKRLQPDCFADLIPLVALFRPGPLQSGMVDDFINRKHGKAKIDYPHPDIEPILRSTYGIILYQEQVMQIAQVLAGYTLGSADILRKAMGKKKPEEMAKQRSIFIQNAVVRGVNEDVATYIFDLMEKFAGYGFNKSHSAAYALLMYQTAWLKTHYPAEFMAAVLSSDLDNTDKVVSMLDECKQMNIKIVPPHVNNSSFKFTVRDDDALLYGLGAIKGLGEAAAQEIVQQRENDGNYQDLFDFCKRIDLRKINRRALEALIKAGALDGLGLNRACLFVGLNTALQAAEQSSQQQIIGQYALFNEPLKPHIAEIPDWSMSEILQAEKETLGFYLSGHPLQLYRDEIKNFCTCSIDALSALREHNVIIAGLIIGLRTMFTKRGDKMAFVTLDDGTGKIDITIFADLYTACKNFLTKDNVIIVEGEISNDEYTSEFRIVGKRIMNMTQARESFAKCISLSLAVEAINRDLLKNLAEAILPFSQGACPIIINYQAQKVKARLALGQQWKVKPADELLKILRNLLGDTSIVVEYQ